MPHLLPFGLDNLSQKFLWVTGNDSSNNIVVGALLVSGFLLLLGQQQNATF